MSAVQGVAQDVAQGVVQGVNSVGLTPVPTTDDAWDAMFPTIANPVSSYDFTGSTAPLVDGIGGDNLTVNDDSPVFAQSGVDPSGYTHVEFDGTNDNLSGADSSVHNMGTSDFSVFIRTAINDVETNGIIMGKRAATGAYFNVWQLSSGAIRTFIHDGSAASLVDRSPGHSNGETIDLMITRNTATDTLTVHVNDVAAGTSTHTRISSDLSNTGLFSINYLSGTTPVGTVQSVSALFVFDYVVSAAEFATIRAGLAG